jgi:hypothetical protein
MGLEDSFDYPLLMAPVKKRGEVFVLQPVLNKKLFRFLKFISVFLETPSENDWLKML